jgi:hypothetical protein
VRVLHSIAVAIVAVAISTRASADERAWTPGTAYLLRPGEIQLGVLSADIGAIPGVQLGTDTWPWVAGLAFSSFVPNAHVVASPIPNAATTIAARAGLYHARVNGVGDANGTVRLVPISLLATIELPRELGPHLEGQYTSVDANGDVRVSDVTVSGGAVSTGAQAGAMAMLRLRPAVALYARGRYQLWQRDIPFDATSDPNEYTAVDAEGTVKPLYQRRAWQALGGVALTWRAVNLQLGVGYGDLFLPAVGVVVPYRGILPDANLFIRF